MATEAFNNDVHLILNGVEVFIVESYRVNMGMLTVPATFEVVLGNGKLAQTLMPKFPPGTKFELQIAGNTQFTGKTDGWAVAGSGGATLSLRGRDMLAELHDSLVSSEKSFGDVSLVDLTKHYLDEVYGAGKYTLKASNAANRSAMSNTAGKKGTKVVKKASKLSEAKKGTPGGPAVPDAAKNIADLDKSIFLPTAGTKGKGIEAKLGMHIYADLLKPQFDRAGLFLFADREGNFILTELGPENPPSYRLVHRDGAIDNMVESFSFTNTTEQRFAKCQVWGRRGGGKEARTAVKGEFVDQEITALGLRKVLILEDEKCTTPEQCEFLAKRKIGESRRAGWQLRYTVGGHVTHALHGGGWCVWVPDSTVDVDDEELGISGPHYIEEVEHVGGQSTTTTMRLMRPTDVIFGAQPPDQAKTGNVKAPTNTTPSGATKKRRHVNPLTGVVE